MHVAVYDGTFDGLLSVVFEAFAKKAFPGLVLPTRTTPPLHATVITQVETDSAKASRVFNGILRKISPEAVSSLLSVWASEVEGSDFLLFRYICKIFDAARNIENNCSDPDVLAVTQLAKKVQCERHLLLGFLRFQKTATGVYFAAVSPRYNIVPLVLPHFEQRFGSQQWLIYDNGRNRGFFFDGHEIREAFVDPSAFQEGGRLTPELLAEDEAFFQRLWKTYFTATAIKERRNSKLQNRCLPPRFRPYMTEFH